MQNVIPPTVCSGTRPAGDDKMLEAMLNPPDEKAANSAPIGGGSPQELMKSLILAGEDAPPLVKKLQEKLRKELGEDKFQYLKKKYGG